MTHGREHDQVVQNEECAIATDVMITRVVANHQQCTGWNSGRGDDDTMYASSSSDQTLEAKFLRKRLKRPTRSREEKPLHKRVARSLMPTVDTGRSTHVSQLNVHMAQSSSYPPSSKNFTDNDEEFDPYLFIHDLPPLYMAAPHGRTTMLPIQTRSSPANTLVLDLDETLVHSSLEENFTYDFKFPVEYLCKRHNVRVRTRPHLQHFMEKVSQLFEIVVFTASQKVYAERVLNALDPSHSLIRHRIYRDSCLLIEGNYMKDLSCLGRDLSRTVIIDNSPQAFGFQLENGIPIESWFDDSSDSELITLLPLLETLANASDVRPILSKHFHLQERVECAGKRAAQKQKKN
mmetsp:Transcript_1013/g.3260  ORF Transcript_1013/g.3260 Transcript_1013/m.3260 type:complete len:348 (+) Transcript_1013:29-1072(+)